MTNQTRCGLLAKLLLVPIVALSAAACGGSDSSGDIDPNAGGAAPATSGGASSSGGAGTFGGAADSGASTGATHDGGSFDATVGPSEAGLGDPNVDGGAVPPPVSIDGGDAGAIECVAGGVLAQEPNDTAAQAQTLPPNQIVCGKVTLGDLDFFTFVLGSATTNMALDMSGNVKTTIHVNGTDITLTPGSNVAVPFVRSQPYVIQVESFDGNPQSYRLRVTQS